MNGKKWSIEEDNILLQMYSTCEKKDIILKIPNRTWNSISTRAIKVLGLSRNMFDWNKEEDEILINKYRNGEKQELIKSLPNRTWMAIQSRASKILNVKRNFREWSKEEIKTLHENYPLMGTNKIKEILPLRSYSSIASRASIENIRKKRGDCDLSPLLSYDPISFYWLGFLLADGHFSLKNKKCNLFLSKKDEDVIYKFASFVSCNNIKTYTHSIGISVYSEKVIPELCKRFSIESNKTIFPPNISIIEKKPELMLALLIGLIDGDGCICRQKGSKVSYMVLTCHCSWFEIYNKFCDFLIGSFDNNGAKPNCYVRFINKKVGHSIRRYTFFSIQDYFLLKEIKKEAIRMKLPIMNRKWDNIDINYVSERENTPMVMKKIEILFKKGFSKSEIIKKTNYTISRVNWAIKKILKNKNREL